MASDRTANDAAGIAKTRIEIRRLKRSIKNSFATGANEEDVDQGRASTIELLEHSIRRRHKRLAVISFAAAIRAGATITPPHWKYGEAVITSMGDDKLRQLVIDAIDGGHRLKQR